MRGHRLRVQLKAGLHNTDADCIVLQVPDRACLLGLEIDPRFTASVKHRSKICRLLLSPLEFLAMPPKSIFRQPGAQHFQVVHRSQRDPLIHDPEASRCQVTALVRNEEKARALRSFQVKALVGSLDDVETIRSLAAQADVVFECVSASSVDFRDKSQTFLR